MKYLPTALMLLALAVTKISCEQSPPANQRIGMDEQIRLIRLNP